MTDNQIPPGRKTLEEWSKSQKYAFVTTVSTFHHTYMVPMDQLQEENPDQEAIPEWLADMVTMEEVEEFSQKHIGELIIDVGMVNEEQMLKAFDRENSYLSDWTKEKKIEWVRKLIEIGQRKFE